MILLGLCALGAGPVTYAAEQDPAVVVIFGDSITSDQGFAGSSGGTAVEERNRDGALNDGRLSQGLTTLLNESRRPSLVPNWGHGGTPTGNNGNNTDPNNGVDRISNSLGLSKSRHAGSQYIVLIMYGANDVDYGISSSDTGFNIRIMIDRAISQEYVPIVATLTPRTDEDVRSRNSAITSSVALRTEEGAKLVDMYRFFCAAAGNPDCPKAPFANLLVDTVHPNDDGYTVIVETWFNEFLAGAIEAQPVIITPILQLLLDED